MIDYPATLLKVGGARTGIAPVNLLDVQTVEGDLHYWADRQVIAPTAISPIGSSGYMLVNSSGLVVNAYNNQAGRGDYFDQASGTSEGQFLLLKGLLDAYSATGNSAALSLAYLLLSALPMLYRRSSLESIPSPISATDIFAPHWLFVVKNAVTSATIHYSESFQFTNGVAVIPDGAGAVRYVFQVVSVGYSLIWENPYSPLKSGTSYAITSYEYDPTKGGTVVTLTDATVNATLAVIHSMQDGPVLAVNQMYEAWPDWRPLADGEIDAACDTFNWAYRAFAKAAAVTGNSNYTSAATATAQQAAIVYDINDSRDWLKPNYQLQPFAPSGSFSYSSMSPAPTFACDTAGNVTMAIAGAVSGEAQYGIASIKDTYAAGDSTVITLGSTIAQTVDVFIDLDAQTTFDPARRFSATLTLAGTGLQEFTLTAANFLNSSGQQLPEGSPVYTFGFDDKSTATHTLIMSRVRQLPNRNIKYLGGAIPFTANFLGKPASLIGWRGPVYMGYQSPWMLKQLGNEANVATCLQMLTDAQDAWLETVPGENFGPFAPVFYFDRSDAVQYGPVNTFDWAGPDPNTKWCGYQYRPLAEVAALAAACNGSEAYYSAAVSIVTGFLNWIDAYWQNATDGPPTDFPQTGAETNYQEPHAAALILRAALTMDQVARPNGNSSGAMNATYQSLLDKTIAFYQSLYNDSGTMSGTFSSDPTSASWYGFWHGEILITLSLLYSWASEANIANTVLAQQVLTWINGMVDFASGASVSNQYQPWLLSVPSFAFHRSMQTDMGSFVLQNLSGDSLARDFEKIARRSALEGAFFIYRLWQPDAEASWIEVHGTLTFEDGGVDTAQLKGAQLMNPSQDDTPLESYCETCQLQWGGKRCGSTQETECSYSYKTCQVVERIMVVMNDYEKNYGETTANTAQQVINRRRRI